MGEFKFNFGFLKNFQDVFNHNKNIATFEVQALFYLMAITGIYRLFERDDLYELLKRAQLIFPDRKLIEQFLRDDKILEFTAENNHYHLDSDLLESFIGFEILDAAENKHTFESWAGKIPNFKFLANMVADNANTLQLDTTDSNITKNNGNIEIDIQKTPDNDVKFNHQDLVNAELFAASVLKDITNEGFDRLKKQFPNKFLQLELRKEPFEEPIFDFNMFSTEKREALWKCFFPKMEYYEHAPTREHHINLIHLAWLWANGFVIEDDLDNVHVDPRIKNFDPNDYEIDGEGFNLWTTKEDESLEDLFPLLEDPEVKKLAERPWENLDIFSEIPNKNKISGNICSRKWEIE